MANSPHLARFLALDRDPMVRKIGFFNSADFRARALRALGNDRPAELFDMYYLTVIPTQLVHIDGALGAVSCQDIAGVIF